MNIQKHKIIVANWKMNFRMDEASIYLNKLNNIINGHRHVDVILAPSMFSLQSLSLQLDRRKFRLAAQNFYWRDMGSFTGEVSIAQLRGIVDYGIIGHSERRHIFAESDRDIRAKVQSALRSNIKPILCIGETMIDRNNNETQSVIADQLLNGLANVTSQEIKDCIIAYEPVWAIGTGQSATPDEVAKAIKIIRRQIKYLYGEKPAQAVNIIYGGSIDQDNAITYLQIKGVDGLMIGKASLNAHQFSAIVENAFKASKQQGEK